MTIFSGWVPSAAWQQRDLAAGHSVLIERPGHTGRETRGAKDIENLHHRAVPS